MRKIQKALSWLLTLTMLLSMTAGFAFGAFADDTAGDTNTGGTTTTTPVVTSGTLKDGVIAWNFDEASGRLTVGPAAGVTSKVNLPDFESADQAPWAPLAIKIKIVKLADGVKVVGAYNFANLIKLESIEFPTTSLEEIHKGAFQNAISLKEVEFPVFLKLIYKFAFNNCSGLTKATRLNIQMTLEQTGNEWLYYLLFGGQQPTTPDTPDPGPGGSGDDSGNTPGGNTPGGNTPGGNTPGGTTAPTSGKCGDNLEWSLNLTTGRLTISGTGAMEDYSTKDAPWAPYMTYISTLVIEEGATAITSNAFEGAIGLKNVVLPSTVIYIFEDAFKGCALLGMSGTAYIARDKGTIIIQDGNSDLEAVLKYKGEVDPPNVDDDSGNTPGGNTPGGNTPGGNTPGGSGNTTVTGTCGANATWEYDTNLKVLTISGSGAMMNYASAAVTPWASYLTSVVKIIVDEGVTTIGTNAFDGASALLAVILPTTVKTIGANAFKDCNILASAISAAAQGEVTIQAGNEDLTAVLTYMGTSSGGNTPGGNTPGGNTPGGNTPGGNTPGTGDSEVGGSIAGTDLTWTYSPSTHALNIKGSGEIPNYTPSKPAPWAEYADEITAITVQDGITRIGNYAFSGMEAVIDVYLPKTLTSIGEHAFRDSTALTTIDLPRNLEEIGQSAFRGCTALTEITLPAKIAEIANDTFRDCSALTEITFNNLVNKIGDNAFNGCKALKNVEFPVTLETIGKSAFYGCSGLEGVILSSDLTVKQDAFSGCTALVKVFLDNCDTPEAESGNEPLLDNIIAATASGTLSNGVMWEVDRVEGTLTFSGEGEVIRDEAWVNELKYVDTVRFRNGITSLAANLFKSDKNIEYVVMADTITTIGDSAFELCENLQSVSLSKNLVSLGKNAFKGCSALTTVTLPEALTVIPSGAFSSCTALTKVTLGEKVTDIGEDAFENCTALKEIEIPATTKTLGQGAFKDCTALEKVTLYNGKLAPLTEGIFVGSTGIKTVDFAGSADEWAKLSANADEELTGAKVEYVVTYTINFVYRGGSKHGQTAYPTMKFNGKPGQTITVEIPTLEHYKASAPTQTYTFGTSDDEKTVHYDPYTYTVTVNYVNAATGELMGTSAPISLMYGDTLTHTAMAINGYTPKQASITVDVNKGNSVFIIEYTLNEYAYTVEFVNSRNDKVVHKLTFTAKYMETVTIKAADLVEELAKIKGYTIADTTATYTLENIQDNTGKITIKCTPDSVKLTVNAIGEDGKPVKSEEYTDHYFGEEVTVKAPVIVGMNPVKSEVTITLGETNEVIFDYVLKEYTITVNFVKDAVGGAVVNEAMTFEKIKHGTKFEFNLADYTDLAMPEGYEVKLTQLTIDEVTGDQELNVIYTIKKFKVTINYVYVDGTPVTGLTPYEQVLNYGTKLEEESPAVVGYTPDQLKAVVEKLTKDEVITITYAKNKYNVTVNFVKDTVDGDKAADSVVVSGIWHGDVYEFLASDFADLVLPEGYEIAGVWKTDALTGDTELTVVCTLKKFTVTIYYVDEKGQPLVGVESFQQIVDYGSNLSQMSPAVAGHTADKASITVENVTKNEEFTVVYARLSYQVTVHLYEVNTSYEIFGKAFTIMVPYGDSYVFNLADHADYVAAAYTTDKVTIDFGAITEDVEGTITYTPKTFTLTVKYQKADGTLVDTKEYSVTAGRTFEIPAWTMEGYVGAEAKEITIGVVENPVEIIEVKEEPKDPVVNPDENPDQGKDPDTTPDPDKDNENNTTDPGDDEKPGNGGKIILVIVIILLVLGGGGVAFYFLYLKKPY